MKINKMNDIKLGNEFKVFESAFVNLVGTGGIQKNHQELGFN